MLASAIVIVSRYLRLRWGDSITRIVPVAAVMTAMLLVLREGYLPATVVVVVGILIQVILTRQLAAKNSQRRSGEP